MDFRILSTRLLPLFRSRRFAWGSLLLFLTVFFFRLTEGILTADGFIGYSPGFYDPNMQENKGAWSESFEQEGVSWYPLYQEPDVKMTFQHRTGTNPHSGETSEEIVLEFPNSGFAFIGHYVDYPILFNETAPSLWVRGTLPNISLGVLVVLPETKRADTGTPLTLLLPGETYTRTGEWEELRFEKDLAALLDETVEAIRVEQKLKVDPSNAYIRQIVLFTEQGSGSLRLWVDDLAIEGHASQSLSVLETSERSSIFDPVNLLAFRFKVTNSPIVMQAAADKLQKWPTEPFAIGSDKIKKIVLDRIRRGESDSDKFVSVYSSKKERAIAGVLPGGDQVESVNFDGDKKSNFSTAEYLDSGFDSPLILGSGTRLTAAEFPESSSGGGPNARFSNRLLLLDGNTPVTIRAIEYQGEPLAFLKQLRFNAVWLKTPPKASLLEEARRENIWLISPPPSGSETVGSNGPEGNAAYFNGTTVSDLYNKVLIWDIGSGLYDGQCGRVTQDAEQIRKLDPYKRPIAGNVRTGLQQYSSGVLDLLVIKRKPILSSLDMANYAKWLQRYPNLMTIGSTFWNEIQTQPDDLLMSQCRFFGAEEEMPSLISYEQIRQQVRISLASNCHGFLFASNSPLNAEDHETQYRACALELVNLELLLIDSWAAGGTAEEIIKTNQDRISATMLRTKSTSLLVPIWTEPNSQLVFGSGASSCQSFIAPSREGYSADLLLPGSLRKIPSHRRAGGIDMSLDEVSMNSLIFLAQSNWYARVVAQKTTYFGQRMAELAIRLAKMRLDTYRDTVAQLASLEDQGEMPRVHKEPLITIPDDSLVVDSACHELTIAEDELRNGDEGEAYLQAERALREIRMTERRLWQIGTRYDLCLPVLPVSVSFSTLPAYIGAYNKIATKKVQVSTENRLAGGDMENIESWSGKIWTESTTSFPGVQAVLNSDSTAKYSGNLGLSFNVTPVGDSAPLLTEEPPIVVEGAANVHTGELICIQGWVRIDTLLDEGSDGFMIYENHGGIGLAQRYYITNKWMPFALYRIAAYDGDMKVTFAMTTFGRVCLDEVSVHPVK